MDFNNTNTKNKILVLLPFSLFAILIIFYLFILNCRTFNFFELIILSATICLTAAIIARIGFNRYIKQLNQSKESLNFALKELTYIHEIIDKHVIYSETDTNGVITRASKAFCDISQYNSKELIGAQHNIIRHTDMPKEAFKDMWQTIESGHIWTGEVKNRKKDGSYYWVHATVLPKYHDGKIIGYAAVRNDISDKKLVEELTITDEQTTLFNRRYFNQVLDAEVRRAQRNGTLLTLAIIDIDFFKNYNDNYGHLKGDKVLRRVALTLKKYLHRAGDYAFRIGGEEFAIISIDMTMEQSIEYVTRIRMAIHELKIEHSGSLIDEHLTISIGLYTDTPSLKTTANHTFKKTDMALYEAKQAGRNRICSVSDNEEN